MVFPERFSNLPEYAWPRLRALLDPHAPGGEPVHMTIGEPRHAFPDWVPDVLAEQSALWAKYPPNEGTPELRDAIAAWIKTRFGVVVDAETQILALNGTREGLFNAAVALCPEQKGGARPVILVPNPFYQVYAVAAAAAGAELYYVNATAETGFLPDFHSVPDDILQRTAIAYSCSPSNPQGAVADHAYLSGLLDLAERYDFTVFSDECYAEVYRDTPPESALNVARDKGLSDERVVIFHSLSKRSNLPGLRSGFAAGGAGAIGQMKVLRGFAGAPLPGPIQAVSTRVWQDEAHVIASRALYQQKFAVADAAFAGFPGYVPPQGGFFLWLDVKDGEAAALHLWTEHGIRVLPGGYLARDAHGINPGHAYIRVALVAPLDALKRVLPQLRTALDTMRTS